MTQHSTRKQQLWLVVGGVVVALLTAAVFTLGSLNIPLTPRQGNAVAILFALSTFIAALLVVFPLILSRSLLRLWSERRSGQMGSRFKVKMVLGAMGVSLLPVVFLFFFSYALVDRTLKMWFPRPLEIASEQSQKLLYDMGKASVNYLSSIATKAAADGTPNQAFLGLTWSVDAEWVADSSGAISHGMEFLDRAKPGTTPSFADHASISPKKVRTLRNGAEVWEAEHHLYIAGSAPLKDGGTLYIARHLPDDYLARYSEIEIETQTYEQQKQQLRTYKRQIILALLLITLLLLFTSTWVALFLSKQVTLPIQALAEATREISRGNFDHRISVQAQDELGTLVRSFNRMTEQLGEGRRQINEFTQSLEQAIEERERRRKLMEAILENIPTGVVSLNASGEVSRVNSAVAAILGDYARTARTLSELLGEEAARSVLHLMRRSLRMGAASRETEIATGGRLVRAAVTVSSLGPRRSNPGYVVVIDDLTDLLRAQKAAAWQEVAQRIAHEIKNPLTPIQLSAQRLSRYLERSRSNPVRSAAPDPPELVRLVGECSALIEREVTALESLVSEFSQFARFPTARLASAFPNEIVTEALAVFGGRLEGIRVRKDLAPNLPAIRADGELLRRVVVNLIDNAAEAMEGSSVKEMLLRTRFNGDRETIEIIVADSGHGISPEDKDSLFLPHFSTKDRGTGLGLAIASRIMAEHHGSIRVEDNSPIGARFVLQLHMTEVAVAPVSPRTV